MNHIIDLDPRHENHCIIFSTQNNDNPLLCKKNAIFPDVIVTSWFNRKNIKKKYTQQKIIHINKWEKTDTHIVNDITVPPDQQLSQKPSTTPSVTIREKRNNK